MGALWWGREWGGEEKVKETAVEISIVWKPNSPLVLGILST